MIKGNVIKNKDGSISIKKPEIMVPAIETPTKFTEQVTGVEQATPATPATVENPVILDSASVKYTYAEGNSRKRINQEAAKIFISSAMPKTLEDKFDTRIMFNIGTKYGFYGDPNWYLTRAFVSAFGFDTSSIYSHNWQDLSPDTPVELPLTTGGTFYIPKIRDWSNPAYAAMPFRSTYYTSNGGSLYIRYNSEKQEWERINLQALIDALTSVSLMPLSTYTTRVIQAMQDVLRKGLWATFTKSQIIYLALQGAGGGGARGWCYSWTVYTPIPITNAGGQGGCGGGGGGFSLVAINGKQVADKTFRLDAGVGGATAADNKLQTIINAINSAVVFIQSVISWGFALAPIPRVSVSVKTSKTGSAGTSSCLQMSDSNGNYTCLVEAKGGGPGGQGGDGNGGKGGTVAVSSLPKGVVSMCSISGKDGGTRGATAGHVEWIPYGKKMGGAGGSYSNETLDWKFFVPEVFNKTNVSLSDGSQSATINVALGGTAPDPDKWGLSSTSYASGGGGGGASVCSFCNTEHADILLGYGGGGVGTCIQARDCLIGYGQDGLPGLVAVVDVYDE